MKFDSIIIGGGLSGLACGIALAERRQRCAIVSTGQSSLHFCSGSFDFLGYVNGFDVETPAETLAKVIPAGHPYDRIGAKRAIDIARIVPDFFSRMGVKVNGSIDRNHYRITPLGIMKPTWLSLDDFSVIAEKATLPWKKVAIQNIAGFLDFHTAFVADNFERIGTKCSVSAFNMPEFERLRTNPTEMRSANIARLFDGNDDLVRRCADIINRNADDAEAVVLPAVFGLNDSHAVEVLKAAVKLPICFIPVLPPSVPGIRTQLTMRRRFEQLGGSYLLGDSVTAARVEGGKVISISTANLGTDALTADSFVLATGSFFSHGIEAHPDKVVEPLFGADLDADTDRDRWFGQQIFGEQPYMTFGVATDNNLRPSIGGNTISNLYAAGAVLSKSNPIKEASGAGISIISALHIADIITKKAQ
ncbi:MAG: glycerol-3-phosphate dehydrogenase subunit GlpB [Muribaculaceae bacterium]